MQPVTAPKCDPAPSRTMYRIQRLWLTPMVRALLRTGIPAFGLMILGTWYVADADRVEQIKLQVSDLRSSIEQRPEFMVNLLRIEDVSVEVAEDIREVTAIDFPISSFDLDLTLMRAQIEDLDAVKRAKLVVRPGGVLDIEVVERAPAIVWRGREALELLDDGGHRVAALAVRSDRRDLPLIVGDGADLFVPEALEILRAAEPIADQLRGLSRVGERRWDLVLRNNRRILLPEIDPISALERVIALDSINDLLSRDIVLIDMRNKLRPTVQLSTDAVDSMRKNNGLSTDLMSKDDI